MRITKKSHRETVTFLCPIYGSLCGVLALRFKAMTNPEELLLGIYARVFLYPRHSLVKAHASFDMGKQLFEAHRVESVEMSLGIEPFGG